MSTINMTDPIEPIVPQAEQIVTDPGYSNDDLKKESFSEIAANKDEPKPAESAPVVEEKPVLDAEKIAQAAAEKVLEQQEASRKAEADRVEAEEAAKKTEQEPSAKEKAYLDWENKFKTDKGRQPTYLEALTFVEEQAIRGIEEKQSAAEAKRQADLAEAQRQKEENDKQIAAVVGDEMKDLYKANLLPEPKDLNDANDPATIEHREFYKQWGATNADRRSKGLPEIYSATRFHQFYYQKPSNIVPPGATAPVAGNKGSAITPSQEQNYTYQDLKKPWSWFGRKG